MECRVSAGNRRDRTLPGTAGQSPSLRNWQIQSLHGQLPLNQQSAALQRCPKSCEGVVLSSAIAESSITIDGVRLVIDSGLSRQLRFDPNTGMEGLEQPPVRPALNSVGAEPPPGAWTRIRFGLRQSSIDAPASARLNSSWPTRNRS